MLEIDSSGGGQVLRTALALSTITGKPFRAENIRSSRPNPGLKAQHIQCIKSLELISGARSEGVFEGSKEISFFPGKVKDGEYEIDIGTAGSITLLLQSLALPCMNHDVSLRIMGGTDTKWAMPMDYFTHVVAPHFGRIHVNLIKRGYYPKGGGLVEVRFGEINRSPVSLVENRIDKSVRIFSHSSIKGVAERQVEGACELLNGYEIVASSGFAEALSPGSGIVLLCGGIGADALGERGKRAEDVGREAAKCLLGEISFPVDSHLADNLIPLLGLNGGEMLCPRITGHVKSNIYAVERFLGVKFIVEGCLIKTDTQTSLCP